MSFIVRRPGLKICRKKEIRCHFGMNKIFFSHSIEEALMKNNIAVVFRKKCPFLTKRRVFEPAQALRVSMEMNSHPRWLPCERTCAWWLCDWRRRYAFLHHTKSIWERKEAYKTKKRTKENPKEIEKGDCGPCGQPDKSFFRLCRTWTKRYLFTLQTVKRVSRGGYS